MKLVDKFVIVFLCHIAWMKNTKQENNKLCKLFIIALNNES